MLKTLSIAAIVGLAVASCPNQCSGHGYCDENDRCHCFKAAGTKGLQRDAWAGADCSLRVCPYGRAHDQISTGTKGFLNVNAGVDGDKNVALYSAGNSNSKNKLKAFLNNGFLLKKDMGLDVQVVSVDLTQHTAQVSWKTNTERTFNPEVTVKTGGAYASQANALHIRPNGMDSGLYIYFDLQTADLSTGSQTVYQKDFYYLNVTNNEDIMFANDNQNNAHGNIECSGRGLCDRVSGSCKCVDGYTGDACQRTECPNDCSGHGTCQSEFYFISDAGQADYKGFDAQGQMGCKCDSGFRGADCSQVECPSGNDPLKGDGGAAGRDCSGRGMCDYTTGLCACFKGFFGERCEEQSNLV